MNEKDFDISSLRKTLHTVSDLENTVKQELDKCKILCCNCHLDIHFDKQKFENYKEEIYMKMNTMKELQPALDKQLVLKMYNDGMRKIDIAKHFNASKGTISDILKKFNLCTPMKNILIDRTEIIKLHNEGLMQKEIAKILNCSTSVISRVIKNMQNNFYHDIPQCQE